MEFLKKIRWSAVALSVLLTIFGCILTFFPDDVSKMFAYMISACLFIVAIMEFYNYFKSDIMVNFFRNDLVFGVAALIVAIILLKYNDSVYKIIPLIFGALIIISGVKKLQNALNFIRLGISGWLSLLIMSAVTLVFGSVIIFFAYGAAKLVIRLIGVGVIFSGLTDLYSAIWIKSCAKKASSKAAEIDFGEEK